MRFVGALLILVSAGVAEKVRSSDSVFNGTVNIQPGRSHIIPVDAEGLASGGRLVGHAEARGQGNDIRVLVVADGDRILFDSGQQRSPRFNVELKEPGEYRVVLDTGFAQKLVFVSVSLEKPRDQGAGTDTRAQSGPIPVNSRVYIDDDDPLGPLYREAIIKRRIPLIVASDSTAPFAVQQLMEADILTLRLLEVRTGSILFTCTAKKVESLKAKESAAEKCAGDLHSAMKR